MKKITLTEKQLVETALTSFMTADFNNQVSLWNEIEQFDGIYHAIQDYGIWPDYLDIDKMHFNSAFGLASTMDLYLNRPDSLFEMFYMENEEAFFALYDIDIELVIDKDFGFFKETAKIVAERIFKKWAGYSQELDEEGKPQNGYKAYNFFKDLIDRDLITIIIDERNKKYAA